MIAFATLILLTQSPAAADFFPLETGLKWHYQANDTKEVTIDLTGKPIDIEGSPATPILVQGKFPTYYRVQGDSAYKVADDPRKPISPNIPILKMGSSNVKWRWDGLDEGMPLSIESESSPPKERDVLGKKTPVVEVRTNATLGSRESGMKFKQTSYYAKGMGLIEMSEELTVAKRTDKRGFKLVKFERSDAKNP